MTGQVSLYEFRGIRLSFAVQGGAKGDKMHIMHEYALYSRGICIIMHVHVLNCHENCGRLYSTERGSEIYAPKGGGVEGSPSVTIISITIYIFQRHHFQRFSLLY